MQAKQLPVFTLFVFEPVPLHQVDKVPLRILTQRRLAKVLIGREKILRLDIKISEIAATAARHQDFLTDLICALEHKNPAAALSSGKRSKKSCCTATQYHNIENRGLRCFISSILLCCHCCARFSLGMLIPFV